MRYLGNSIIWSHTKTQVNCKKSFDQLMRETECMKFYTLFGKSMALQVYSLIFMKTGSLTFFIVFTL